MNRWRRHGCAVLDGVPGGVRMSLASVASFAARNWKWEVPLVLGVGVGGAFALDHLFHGGGRAAPTKAEGRAVTAADERVAQATSRVVVSGEDPYSGAELESKAQIVADIRAKAGIAQMDDGTAEVLTLLGGNFGLEALGVERTADVLRAVRELGIDTSTRQGGMDAYLAAFDVFRSGNGTADDMVERFRSVDEQLAGVEHDAGDVASVMRFDDERIGWMRDVIVGTNGFLTVRDADRLRSAAELGSPGDDAFSPATDARTAASEVLDISRAHPDLTSHNAVRLESAVLMDRIDSPSVARPKPIVDGPPRTPVTPTSIAKFASELDSQMRAKHHLDDAVALASSVANRGGLGEVTAAQAAAAYDELEPLLHAKGLDIDDSAGHQADAAILAVGMLGTHGISAQEIASDAAASRAERPEALAD